MVKAVQPEAIEEPTAVESPNSQGKGQNLATNYDKMNINPGQEVSFDIDFEGDDRKLDAVSENAKGGTELMKEWLFTEMEKREPGLKDKFQFIMTRIRELEPRQRILWLHDLANDPEVQHLKENPDSWSQFERLVFVSHWQQYQFYAYLGIPYDQGIVIQNAIAPIPEHEKPKNERINCCYFSTPHRGLEVLLNSWEFMRQQLQTGENAELNIYSSFAIYDRPHLDEQFRHIYKRAREMDGVNYHGTVSNDEIREMLQTQHIFAYPSVYEETICITFI